MNREQRHSKGICYDCHEFVLIGKTRCQKHLHSNKTKVKHYYNKMKEFGSPLYKMEPQKKRIREYNKKNRRGKGRFNYAKQHALRRNKEWNLTEDQFKNIISLPCFYCNRINDVEAGIGLDRLDNNQGYLIENVVSCCIDCNYVRGNRFSPQEMQLIGKVIAEIKSKREK